MTFTLATVNVNGLRAAARKGMGDWLAETSADVITLQEVRAPEELLADLVGEDWSIVGEASQLKGRAGVAIAARTSLEGIDLGGARRGLPGLDADAHTGRWLEADLADPLGDGTAMTVISCYMHSGNTEKPQTMTDKYEFLDVMMERLEMLHTDGRHVVLTGDINIAHTEWDIKNFKGNRKSAASCPRSAPTSTGSRRSSAGSMCTAPSTVRAPAPTPGGPSAARPSTTTPAGGSTTSWPPRSSPLTPAPHRWTAPPATTPAGPTTRRW